MKLLFSHVSVADARQETSHQCGKCKKFGCPFVMQYSNIIGCDRDIMEQIWAGRGKHTRSRSFDEVEEELRQQQEREQG